jgi:type II secretory pathway predicted ATPase ExeA
VKDSYLSAFGLEEPPFSKEIADRDLWLPSSKTAIVEELVDAVEERASVLLTGEPGVGKTCVLRALRARLPAAGFRLTYCHNATLGRRDFYRQLCLALGLSPHATAAAVFYNVATHVQDLAQQRVHPVFLIDEAHLLHEQMLGHLHILLNYEWDSKALLSLVLVGLPELDDLLKMRRYRSLYSRLHVRLHVDALTPEDTAEYLRYRMKRAGVEREIFTADAVAMLHEAASGGMRDLDRLATGCLHEAARKKRKLVERDLLARVVDRDRLERDA